MLRTMLKPFDFFKMDVYNLDYGHSNLLEKEVKIK